MKMGQRFKRFLENLKEAMEVVEEAMEEEFDKDMEYFNRQTVKKSNITTKQKEDEEPEIEFTLERI